MRKPLPLLFAILIAVPALAADTVPVSGTVIAFDESFLKAPHPAANAKVGVVGGSESVNADANGAFTVPVPRGTPVTLVVEGQGLARSIQPTRTYAAAVTGERVLAVPLAMDGKSDAIQTMLTGIIGSMEVGQKRDPKQGKVLGLCIGDGKPLVGATVKLESAHPDVAKRRAQGETFVAPCGALPGDEGFFILLNVPPGPVDLVTSDFPESRSAHARFLLDPLKSIAEPGAVTVALMTGKPNPWQPPPEEKAPVRFEATDWSRGYRNQSKNTDADASLALGSGIGVGDLDGDGRLDLLVTGGMGFPNAVLLQKTPGKFEMGDGGLASPGPEKVAVALGDLDNDGDLDVYQASLGADQLFENLGGGTFREISRQAYVSDPGNARTAAMADVDGDGLLDIFCGNYDLGSHVDMDSLTNPGQGNTLHRNLGRLKFKEVSQEAGLRQTGLAFAQAFVDLDGDGLDDLILAHDHGRLRLYLNRSKKGEVRFADVSEKAGITGSGSWMGIAVGDYDNDGKLDFFVTNTGFAEPMYDPVAPEQWFTHALYHNDGMVDGVPHFTDVAKQAGVADAGWGWGCRFEDFDNDGNLDLVIVTNMFIGAIGAADGALSILGPMPPGGIGGTEGFVFWSDGHGHFREGTKSAGIKLPYDGRAVTTPDLDGDGFPDLVVGNERGPFLTYRNQGGTPGAWIELELEGDGKTMNRDAIGAIVTVKGAHGQWTRQRSSGDGFKSSASPVLHFGLGGEPGPVEAVVHWPGGKTQSFPGLAVRKKHRLSAR